MVITSGDVRLRASSTKSAGIATTSAHVTLLTRDAPNAAAREAAANEAKALMNREEGCSARGGASSGAAGASGGGQQKPPGLWVNRAQPVLLWPKAMSANAFRMDLLRRLLERMSGRRAREGLFQQAAQGRPVGQTLTDQEPYARFTAPPQACDGQIAVLHADTDHANYRTDAYYVSREYSLKQTYSFNAQAVVRTADGRKIDVKVELNFSHEVYRKIESLSVSTMSFMDMFRDPLVINYGGHSAELTDAKMRFDLDADGSSYQISMLREGSGFLALDAYGDGVVRDGSQLFGTKSGDGFADLAAYDFDHNGWIDENDDIFDKLRIWYTDGSGRQQLAGLGEMGVGAIFLGSAAADYALYGSSAVAGVNGMIRADGVFLYENGLAGTMQHVDLRI